MTDITNEAPKATIKEVRDFFGMSLAEMKAEWTQGGLSKAEKDAIQIGIANGTFTY